MTDDEMRAALAELQGQVHYLDEQVQSLGREYAALHEWADLIEERLKRVERALPLRRYRPPGPPIR